MTAQQLAEAREWIADCVWADLDQEDIDALTDDQVTRGVRRHYSGGVAQFVSDCQ